MTPNANYLMSISQNTEHYKNIYKFSAHEANYYEIRHGANVFTGDSKEFKLHYHPNYEIYIYLSGKAEFMFEGTNFSLNPYDIMLIPAYSLHCPIPHVGEFFERYVINITDDFCKTMNCYEYLDVFANQSGRKYKIPGHVVKRSNLFNIINFFLGHNDHSKEYIIPLVRCKILELLYYLNTIGNFEECTSINKETQEIMAYIDENFDIITDVDSITSNFFYSKNHQGHLFKKHTGITITQYLNIKRLENVEKLYRQGNSLLHSCIESGFKSYDSFAYTYKKEFGISPKKGLLNRTDS
ncbi:MAG: helix-turn-helix domain-containing protein [Clostridia bacterium]|nr:helix-turn-helix domain-containing protein [Clostridia bacterium]